MTEEELKSKMAAARNGRGKTRYSDELRREALEFAQRHMATGRALESIAQELGMSGWTLQRWRQRSRGATSRATERLGLASFVRLEPAVSLTAAPLELVLSSGAIVRVPVGFDGETLSRVLALAEGGAR